MMGRLHWIFCALLILGLNCACSPTDVYQSSPWSAPVAYIPPPENIPPPPPESSDQWIGPSGAAHVTQ